MSNVTAVPIKPIKRSVTVWIVVGVLLAVVAGGWLAFRGTAQVAAEAGDNAKFLAWNKTRSGVVETASGLQYEVLKKGEGTATPTDTDVALITYKGSLRDGTVFDQSQRPTPMPVNGSIKGFSEALKLMPKGALYRLWIKPDLAYGDQSPDPSKIPNGSLLVFDVGLLDFLPQQVIQQMQAQQMMQQQQGGAGAPPPGPGAGQAPGMPQ